jgi:hypothetical protein
MAHHIHLPETARHDKSINRRAVKKPDIRFDGNPLLGKNLSSLFGDKITPGIETGKDLMGSHEIQCVEARYITNPISIFPGLSTMSS